MSPTRADVVMAVVLSCAVAAVSDLQPPTFDDAAEYIVGAVERHHVGTRPRDDEERRRTVTAQLAACRSEKRTAAESRVLGEWISEERIARWRLADTDSAAVHVSKEQGIDRVTYQVTIPCADGRACVDLGAFGSAGGAVFEFTSEQVAQRVAAAYRHVANLCRESLQAAIAPSH